MISRRWKRFYQAHALLEELRALQDVSGGVSPASSRLTATLGSLQKLLIREISRAERKVRRTKAILKDLEPLSEKAVSAKERLEAYRHLAYLWRCFGDAIAFTFLDKYALKQTYFNTNNAAPKQDAVFLGGKAGLKMEIEIAEAFLNCGVPALLCDLTNTIRHGDVCVMIGPDPQLVEVKTGSLDSRGRRQRKAIQQLMDFFQADKAEGLRGFGKVLRVAHRTPEVTYLNELNECIRAAIRTGAAWRSPEKGLFYVAVANDNLNLSSILSSLPVNRPTIFMLNEVKASRAWAPYNPFTLSIRDRGALFGFFWGEIYLLVIYETDALRRLAESQGMSLTFFEAEADYAFEVSLPGEGGQMRLARQMFDRLAMDFTSPAWLLQASLEGLDQAEAVEA